MNIDRAFLNHCLALARLARVRGPVVSRIAAGAELLGKLRKWEARGARLALRLCNGPEFKEGGVEKEKARIIAGVLGVLPKMPRDLLFIGAEFWINSDPRGYALKVGAKSTRGDADACLPRGALPGMHRDWGGYGILAPDFAGRS